MPVKGAEISKVSKGGLAKRVGLKPKDIVCSINKKKLKDIIDYEILQADEKLEIEVDRPYNSSRVGKLTFHVEKKVSQSLGVYFSSSIFDKLRRCTNRCIFCFIDQLPKGLRDELYLRDDDFRLSFLYGNFITLTNLLDEDIERIIRERLSPLYVSIHTTNQPLREFIMRPKVKDKALYYLKVLSEEGIKLHIQIVLLPYVNDGQELFKTVFDLSKLKGVESIGVVPVGLTSCREGLFPLRGFKRSEAKKLIKTVSLWQDEFLKLKGSPLVYLADEFYLMSRMSFPSLGYYGDFYQLENGIGIVPSFENELDKSLRGLKKRFENSDKFVILTGTLAESLIARAASKIEKSLGGEWQVFSVPNSFFGNQVNVSGLIAARDLTRFLSRCNFHFSYIFAPDVALNSDNLFIDGPSLDDFKNSVNLPIEVASAKAAEFVEKVCELEV